MYDIGITEKNSQCLKSFFQTASKGYYLFGLLSDSFFSSPFPEIVDYVGGTPSGTVLSALFEQLLEKLKTGAESDQTFAFKYESTYKVYYWKDIVLPREFKFLTEGSVQPDTKSMLTYDQFFPFNNKNHVDTNCVPVEELPLFYKNKGIDT